MDSARRPDHQWPVIMLPEVEQRAKGQRLRVGVAPPLEQLQLQVDLKSALRVAETSSPQGRHTAVSSSIRLALQLLFYGALRLFQGEGMTGKNCTLMCAPSRESLAES
jgi:hypothetical protein